MIAIYQSLLHRLQTNFSHIKYITDKSDNAGCYLVVSLRQFSRSNNQGKINVTQIVQLPSVRSILYQKGKKH